MIAGLPQASRRAAASPSGAIVLIRGILGGSFMLAAFLKSIWPTDTLRALDYLLQPASALPAGINWWMLTGLLSFEIVLGSFLAVGAGGRATVFLACATLLVFTSYVAWLVVSGSSMSCGCGPWWFQLTTSESNAVALGRNVGLFGMSIVLAHLTGSRTHIARSLA